MHTDERNAMTSKPLAAGIGALAFGAMTLAAMFISDAPGGNYTSAQVVGYVSRGERASQLLAFFLAMCAIPGLIYMLAHVRDALAASPSIAAPQASSGAAESRRPRASPSDGGSTVARSSPTSKADRRS